MRKLIIRTVFALCLIVGALPASAQTAYVYAVHGIPGDNGFPVDISVDGVCAVTGFTFGNLGGPLSLPAGSHSVNVYAANTTTPCSGSPALSAAPDLTAGKTYALVAHLTATGSATLTGFAIDLSRPAPGNGRFILHHTAAAPAVNVNVNRGDGGGKSPTVAIPGFANGAQVGAEFRPGDWYATLSVGSTPVFGPTMLTLSPKSVQLVFAVGTFPDTFTYIVKVIPIM